GWRRLELEPFAGLADVHLARADYRDRGRAAARDGGHAHLAPAVPDILTAKPPPLVQLPMYSHNINLQADQRGHERQVIRARPQPD
ncbi:hypothetical protein, partial [Pseudomonas aeruginosa]